MPKHGDGIRKRDDSGLYEARYTTPEGKRRSVYGKTKQEAKNKRLQKLAAIQSGKALMSSKRKTGDYLLEWLERKRNITPNSRHQYGLLLNHVLPYIGNIRLGELKLGDIEECFAELDNGRIANSTLAHTYTLLKTALEHAVDLELIERNPMRRMEPPRMGESTARAMSAEEARGIIAASRGTRWHAMITLLATTGLRAGELLGLKWEDIDLDTGVIKVRRQANRIHGEPGLHLVPLKTRTSRRDVRVPPVVLTALKQHQQAQRREMLACPPEKAQFQNLVFCMPHGTIYHRSTFRAAFLRLCEHAGVEGVTPHTFRHTVSTLLQEEGNSVTVPQAVLGHSRASITLDTYTHRSRDAADRAAATMDRLLFGDLSDAR